MASSTEDPIEPAVGVSDCSEPVRVLAANTRAAAYHQCASGGGLLLNNLQFLLGRCRRSTRLCGLRTGHVG